MFIIPAIDLIDGKCVRLTEGDFNRKTEYSNDPVKQARIFKDLGAKSIHIIDLDGASSGKSKNRAIIKQIKKETKLTVQTGGGIRTEDDILDLIHAGIDKIILGTMLVEKFDVIEKIAMEYKSHLLAGIDVKDGTVKTKGWKEGEGIDPIELGKKVFQAGISTAVYTDISRDGKLTGPNIEATKDFATKTGLHVIISGGISNENDILEASTLQYYGILGIIVGKAYYEGKVDLKKIFKKHKG